MTTEWRIGQEVRNDSIYSPWYIEKIEIKHRQTKWDVNVYQIAHLRSKAEPKQRTQWSVRI